MSELIENWVWEDDPRLRDICTGIWVNDGEHVQVFRAGVGDNHPLGLLVRSGDTLRVLPVKKRRKKLEYLRGQRWKDPGGDRYLLCTNTVAGCERLWCLIHEATHEASYFVSWPVALFLGGRGENDDRDPRDHGWELLDG